MPVPYRSLARAAFWTWFTASRAGDMIEEIALAMWTGMFTGRLAQTTHAHPTCSLAVQQAAAQFFDGYGDRAARTGHNAA